MSKSLYLERWIVFLARKEIKSQTARGDNNNPAETISRLQRGVLKLALSFQRQSADLDNGMKESSTLIRVGQRNGRLQNAIDEIVDTTAS
ncbi:MAG: hypothetical protein VCB07_07695 [Gammaproteobacteria bacterium]